MMGTKIRDFSPLDNLSLEELVPKDNFYRRLQEEIDLSFVRELVRDCYSPSGRPSVDPEVFFKLELVLFFEDLRSERQLMEVVADRLSLRWYLGYDLHEPLPDHSSLTRIRGRYGLEIFRAFFEAVVEMCIEAGLVWGEELYFDATKVEADASPESVRPRLTVEEHLSELFSEETDEPGESESPSEVELPSNVTPLRGDSFGIVGADLGGGTEPCDWISTNGRQQREITRGHYKRQADSKISTTDPDASMMQRGAGKSSHPGYHAHYVVDGGKARVILQALVTPSEVMENQPMLDLLWRSCFRWGIRPRQVTGDTTYGTVENIKAIEDADIHAYLPLPDLDKRTPFFGKTDFTYDAGKDIYVCPQGEDLNRYTLVNRDRVVKYKADAATCNACPLKSDCTTSSNGRLVSRSFDEAYLDVVRAYHLTEPYKKAIRKRKVWVEPMFAEAKVWHGLRRFRLRRLERVNIEALLIASGQNIKRLLTFGRRRQKAPAQAAALRLPNASGHKFRHAREHRADPSWQLARPFSTLPVLISSKAPALFLIKRKSATINPRKRLLIIGGRLQWRRIPGVREGRLGEVADSYQQWLESQPLSANTKRTYRVRVEQFLDYLVATPTEYGDPLCDPHARDYAVRDFKTHLKTVAKARPSSVNLTLAAIDNFYRFLGMGKPGVKREDLPGVAPGALEGEEQKRFLRAVERSVSARDKAIAKLLFFAGLRVSELVGLDVCDVSVSARKGLVVVRSGKGDAYREVALNAEVRGALQEWLLQRKEFDSGEREALFLNRRGGRLSTKAVDIIVRRFGEEANLERPVSAHVLRHTCMTNLVRAGNDLVMVAEIAGHKRLETTRRYSLPSEDDRRAAMEGIRIEY